MIDMRVGHNQQINVTHHNTRLRQLRLWQVVMGQLQNLTKLAKLVLERCRLNILCIFLWEPCVDQDPLSAIGHHQESTDPDHASVRVNFEQPVIKYVQLLHLPLDETCRTHDALSQ